MKKWSIKEIEFLRINYPDKTNKELREVLGKNESAISFQAWKLGLKKKIEAISRARKKMNLDITKEMLEDLYCQQEKSVRTISEELGIGKNTALYYLNKFRITRRNASEANQSFYRKGNKHWRTGLNKNDSRIMKAAESLKKTNEQKRALRLKMLENKIGSSIEVAIREMYWNKGMTQEKIASVLGVSRVNIIKLMRKYEIPKKSNFEVISHLSGPKHSQYGRKWEKVYGREELISRKKVYADRFRQLIIKRLKNNEMPIANTKIERILARAMKTNKIEFVQQYAVDDRFVCDFALPNHRTIIECDGDYWHANPELYDPDKLDHIQQRKLQIDKSKNTYLSSKGWIVLRFFEKDIKKSLGNCVNKIKEKILGQQRQQEAANSSQVQ